MKNLKGQLLPGGQVVGPCHVLITEPITIARAQKVLIGWPASLPWRDGS